MKGASSYRTLRDEVEKLEGKDIQFLQNKILNSSLFALVDNCMIDDQIVNYFFNYLSYQSFNSSNNSIFISSFVFPFIRANRFDDAFEYVSPRILRKNMLLW